MLYLMDKLDLELFDFTKNNYMVFDLWEIHESKVQRLLENERCRSVFSRLEIINLFKTKHKIQMVQVKKIKLNRFDKIILWTLTGKYFALEIKNIYQ